MFQTRAQAFEPNIAVMEFAQRRLQQRNLFRDGVQIRLPAFGEHFDRVAQTLGEDSQLVKLFDMKRKVQIMTGVADFFDSLDNYPATDVNKCYRRSAFC